MLNKVLIIDDDSDIANVAAIWVRSAGYDSIIAADGASGLATAERCQPNAILLDIMMPGIDGFEVGRRLKANPHLAHIPVIFLSAKVQETARREAIAAGATYFLSKPYEGAELIQALASVLDLHHRN